MKTAVYIGKLTGAGVEPKLAQVYGEAIEMLISDDYVTKSHLDSRLSDLKATIYQALFVQGIAIIGLTAALIKLLK